MESEAEDQSGIEEVTESLRTETAEKESEGKGQEKGRHDGSEADT